MSDYGVTDEEAQLRAEAHAEEWELAHATVTTVDGETVHVHWDEYLPTEPPTDVPE